MGESSTRDTDACTPTSRLDDRPLDVVTVTVAQPDRRPYASPALLTFSTLGSLDVTVSGAYICSPSALVTTIGRSKM